MGLGVLTIFRHTHIWLVRLSPKVWLSDHLESPVLPPIQLSTKSLQHCTMVPRTLAWNHGVIVYFALSIFCHGLKHGLKPIDIRYYPINIRYYPINISYPIWNIVFFSTIRSIFPIFFWGGIINWIVGDPTVGISGWQGRDRNWKVLMAGPYGHPLGITKSMENPIGAIEK